MSEQRVTAGCMPALRRRRLLTLYIKKWRDSRTAESPFFKKQYRLCKSVLKGDKVLGEGHYGKVVKGYDKVQRRYVAVKCLSIADVSKKRRRQLLRDLRNEMKSLQAVSHVNIVTVYDYFEDFQLGMIYLVEEFLSGGDLFDKVDAVYRSGDMFVEEDIQTIVRSLASALEHCHQHGIIHRDIKPENIMLDNKAKPNYARIKLVDFGFVAKSEKPYVETLKTKCGTNGYFAPEVLFHHFYSAKCDVWGVGLIACILASGRHPLQPLQEMIEDRSRNQGKKLMPGERPPLPKYYIPKARDKEKFRLLEPKDFKISLKKSYYRHLSAEAKTVMRDMLKINPDQRKEFKTLMKNVWLKPRAQAAAELAAQAFLKEQKESKVS